MDPLVIVGGGPAGAAAARRLVRSGASVVVFDTEVDAPYDRTTLSTTELFSGNPPPLWTPQDRDLIDVRTETVIAVQPAERTLRTDRGTELRYRQVLLATGARPRQLTAPGFAGAGVHTLRAVDDARALAAALRPGARLAVIGAGVVGLEVAATARDRGHPVQVIEVAARVLSRSAPAAVARWLADKHREHGVHIRTGVTALSLERSAAGLPVAVTLSDGSSVPADVVLVGIGVEPNDALAAAAGIETADGIVVDTACRTSAQGVLAAGDVSRMDGVRLESYQAAGQQGEVAAAVMLGEDAQFTEVPWTWSDQYDVVLQAAGLSRHGDDEVDLTTPDAAMVLGYRQGRLVAACGAAVGPEIARPIRAAAALIARGGTLPIDTASATLGNLAALTTALRDAARHT